MTQANCSSAPDAATDPRIDPQVRSFLTEMNKDSSPFWELPQPKPQEILTGLQNKTAGRHVGRDDVEKTITQDGRTVKLYIMKPEHVTGSRACCSSFMAASGSSAISRTISACCAISSSARARSACSSNTLALPAAKFPTQLEESYAALKWVAEHAGEFGADGSRIAVAGNSVGGNMTAALTLMAKDRNGPEDQLSGAHDSGDRRKRRYRILSRVWDRPLPGARLHEVWLGPLRSRREDARQSLRVAAAGEHRGTERACRRRWSSPRRTIRCATKARPMPAS